MKIAYLCPAGHLGGAERSLLDLIASMRETELGAELSLIIGADGPLAQEAERLGVRTHLLPMPEQVGLLGDSRLRLGGRMAGMLSLTWRATPAGLATLRYARRLRRVFEQIGPTLVHSNANKSHLLACLTVTRGTPVVWHVRDFLGSRPMMARALRWASRRAAGAIAISEAVGQDAQSVLRGLPVEVIHNAIDTDYFAPGPGNGRSLDDLGGLAPAEDGTVRVGLVATYGRWKGHVLFLQAAAKVLSARPRPPLRFYIVGGPIYRTIGSQFSEGELRARAVELNIASQVGFIRFQRDIPEIYRALDLIVHASTEPEPFGRAIVEAMGCGRAVIATLAGGSSELFTDGLDAVGVAAGDVEALALAIGSLVGDAERRVSLGSCGRRTVVERFSRRRLGRQVAAAYQRFTSRGLREESAAVPRSAEPDQSPHRRGQT